MLGTVGLQGVAQAFPYFFVVDRGLCITHASPRYERVSPSFAVGAHLPDIAHLARPTVELTLAQLCESPDMDFVLQSRETPKLQVHGHFVSTLDDRLLFLGTPWLTSLADIAEAGLSLADFPSHDLVLTLLTTAHAKDVAQADARRLVNELRLANRRAHVSTELAETSAADAQRLASLGRLVASMAHEINTPLGVARIASSLIEEQRQTLADRFVAGSMTRGQLQQFLDDTGDAVTMLSDNMRRAAEIIASFRQIAVDRRSEEPRTVRLVPFMEEVLNGHAALLVQARVQVAVVGDRQLANYTYPDALARLLSALVENAVSHAYADVAEPKLTLRVWDSGSACYLSCEDNGVGVPESIRDRIFEPFFTTRRMTGGTGLGLYVAHNIANELLGGSIGVEPVSPRGCRIVVRSPKSRKTDP